MKKAALGEMRERLNRAVSKTVVPQGTGGSNPPLSVLLAKTVIAIWRNYAKVRRKSGDSIVSTKRAGAASGEGGPEELSVIVFFLFWRDVRVVEGARLEGVCARESTGGSNPPLSVKTLITILFV